MSIHTICYLSSAETMGSDKEIRNLLEYSAQKNLKRGVTGILLYMEGNFMQILEGPKDLISPLFETIQKDPRHKNIIKLLEREIPYSLFEAYESGFSIISSRQQIDQLQNYLSYIKLLKTEFIKSILPTIEGFLRNISPKSF